LLFPSNVFILLFLPVALCGYQLLSRFGRVPLLLWLTGSSLFFYGYWNPVYLVLLCSSILINFFFSYRISENKSEISKSYWLAIAITANLLLLTYFKYLFPVLNFLHIHNMIRSGFSDVVLPLGISFFTFTQIAYLIDLRQQISGRRDLLTYSVFVTFFPHLIAGPIIHPRDFIPQLDRLRGLRSYDVALGLSWFVMGLSKKVFIADRIAPLAEILYAHPQSAGFATTWIGVLAYTMQLYFDFSGYSDMALGLARMFSLEFPINFDSPFKAQSIIDFWQHWHMTLSRYLNEYLFSPILLWVNGRRYKAGKKSNRKAAATPEGFLSMVFFPTMITMFIAGVWHGAGLQFIVFGVLHGFYLSINHAWRLLTPRESRLHKIVPAPVMIVLTFLCVAVGMIFFRSANVHDAFYILGTMSGFHTGPAYAAFPFLAELPYMGRSMHNKFVACLALGLCFFIVWAMPNTQEILGQVKEDSVQVPNLAPGLKWRMSGLWSMGLTVLFCLVFLFLDSSSSFLYFQF
jgi:alginate O-acetyltransferase complex protein AlgI